jgi:hypothetical protein
MPLTALTTLLGSFTMIGSWWLVKRRIARSLNPASYQIKLLDRFFLLIGLFFFLVFLPNTVLALNPAAFPMAMAWGYIIGHIFLYAALIAVLELMFSMVPKLAGKQRYVILAGSLVATVITAINIKTMVFGILPQYDHSHSVILFNAHPVVGAGIAIFALAALLPTAILLIRNGLRNPASRVRSLLLGIGFILLMAAGPLHDNAKTSSMYVTADLLSMFSLLIVTAGVLYRFEERLASSEAARTAHLDDSV